MPHHTEALAGGNGIIICDNDHAGYIHARSVNKQLTDAGCYVKVFKPGKHKDVADLLKAGEKLKARRSGKLMIKSEWKLTCNLYRKKEVRAAKSVGTLDTM